MDKLKDLAVKGLIGLLAVLIGISFAKPALAVVDPVPQVLVRNQPMGHFRASVGTTWQGNNLLPGGSIITNTLQLKNNGGAPADHLHLRLQLTNSDLVTPLAPYLRLTALTLDGESLLDDIPDSSTDNNDFIDLADWAALGAEGLRVSFALAPGQIRSLAMSLQLDSQAPSAVSGDRSVFKLTVFAHKDAVEPTSHNWFRYQAHTSYNLFQTSRHISYPMISEVYYQTCTGCGSDPTNEWIELHNPTNAPVNIGGWKIEDNSTSSDLLPLGTTIPASGYLVITPNVSTFDFWPDVAMSSRVVLGSSIGNGLANTGDRLILKNDAGMIVDSLSYGSNTTIFNPSIQAVAKGHSLARDPIAIDTNSTADFIDHLVPTLGF